MLVYVFCHDFWSDLCIWRLSKSSHLLSSIRVTHRHTKTCTCSHACAQLQKARGDFRRALDELNSWQCLWLGVVWVSETMEAGMVACFLGRASVICSYYTSYMSAGNLFFLAHKPKREIRIIIPIVNAWLSQLCEFWREWVDWKICWCDICFVTPVTRRMNLYIQIIHWNH